MNKKVIWASAISLVVGGLFLISPVKGFTDNHETELSEDELKEQEELKKEEERLRIEQEEIRKQEELKQKQIEEAKKVEEIFLNNAGEQKDKIGFYYYNLNSKVEYKFNESTEFRTASTIKLPQAMMICDDIYNGKLSLDTIMTYNSASDYEAGTGSLQYRDTIGQVSIREALELSITQSDNIAYRMLKRHASQSVWTYLEQITGIDNTTYNLITAEQGMLVLKKLYENENNNPHYETIIEHLKNTVFDDTFAKYVPKEKVAHKIGSYYRYYHDYGIIFGEEDYILVMFSKDVGKLPSGDSGSDEVSVLDGGAFIKEVSANISKEIYEINNQQN